MSELVTGIESIDPIEVVIEKRGANSDKVAEVMPIVPIASVSRRKFVSDLKETPSLRKRNADRTTSNAPSASGGAALIGIGAGRNSSAKSRERMTRIPRNVKPNSKSPLPKCPTDPKTQAPFTYTPTPKRMAALTI